MFLENEVGVALGEDGYLSIEGIAQLFQWGVELCVLLECQVIHLGYIIGGI